MSFSSAQAAAAGTGTATAQRSQLWLPTAWGGHVCHPGPGTHWQGGLRMASGASQRVMAGVTGCVTGSQRHIRVYQLAGIGVL